MMLYPERTLEALLEELARAFGERAFAQPLRARFGQGFMAIERLVGHSASEVRLGLTDALIFKITRIWDKKTKSWRQVILVRPFVLRGTRSLYPCVKALCEAYPDQIVVETQSHVAMRRQREGWSRDRARLMGHSQRQVWRELNFDDIVRTRTPMYRLRTGR